jgi:hypothetical protein
MALSCLGSLNALEQTGDHAFWRKRLKKKVPSADTMGRVFALVEPDELRVIAKRIYAKLKRNKALLPFHGNWFALILDGHESMASYLRCCQDCLQRRIETKQGECIQYYHRHVMAMLWCGNICLPLDVEPQRPGEDEVAAALRLLQRVFVNYPRAFDVILADGLYLQQRFFNAALAHKKHVMVVLKNEQRDLLQDARLLFPFEAATGHQAGKTRRDCWDIEGFPPWFKTDQKMTLRVVRSLEQTSIRRQRTGKEETQTSEWIWATTIPPNLIPTQPLVECGHGRWNIENKGFNELVNQWHFNHTYKHDLTAMTNFWLMTMIAHILFHAFFLLNLKPQARANHSKAHFIAMMLADLLAPEPKPPP